MKRRLTIITQGLLRGERMQNTEEGYENGYTVLMSVYQKEKPEYLRESISSMLRQTLPCSDFVLVCDGPLSHELLEIVNWAAGELKEKFQCIRIPENKGLGNALKVGMEYCRCPFIARMDSDDISRPDRCRLQMDKIQEGNYGIVGGILQEFVEKPGDTEKLRRLPERPEEILKFASRRNPFNHPCVMFRKDAVEAVGGYEDFPGFEDYALWIRMLKEGYQGWNLQDIILDMRTGNGMYERRGGYGYLKSVFRFQNYMRKEGFIGWRQFLENCIIRGAVGMMPDNLRENFYRFFLRKKNVPKKRGRGE